MLKLKKEQIFILQFMKMKKVNAVNETIPLNEVVERLKQGLSPVPEKNKAQVPLKFIFLQMIWYMYQQMRR